MACQHPNCSYPIHSICVHHCHWSLCEKHIDEHKRSLTVEFEELLQDLIEPADQLSNIVDKTKNSLTLEHQKQLDCLKQTYEKQINEIEQQLANLSEIQDQRNNISKQLSKIQANEILLTHDDFQKIEFLTKEITQFMKSSKDKEENKVNLQPKRSKFTKCPLTTLNVYGLALSHNVRLCCPKKKIQHLYHHLCNYHRLKTCYTNELIQAIKFDLDPKTTVIFPLNTKIISIDDKYPCPLHYTSIESEIRCAPCTTLVTRKFLPVHLQTVHRLRAPEIKEILKKN